MDLYKLRESIEYGNCWMNDFAGIFLRLYQMN